MTEIVDMKEMLTCRVCGNIHTDKKGLIWCGRCSRYYCEETPSCDCLKGKILLIDHDGNNVGRNI